MSDVKAEEHGLLADEYPGLYKVIDAAGDVHGKSMQAYLIMMSSRLIELKRVLKPTGSIYLHCDPTASHYLKLLMDAMFDKNGFRNEVVWSYRKMPNKAAFFQRNHDILLFYSRSDTHTFNRLYEDYSPSSARTYERARRVGYNANLKKKMVTVFDWGKYRKAVEAGDLPSNLAPSEFQGKGAPRRSVWDLPILAPTSKERTGYPTQKPLALLNMVIEASSNPGDLVLDPFCGCATTLVSAHNLEREWIGIDISPKAVDLVQMRLKNAQRPMFSDVIARTDIPKRTDLALGLAPEPKQQKHTLYGIQEGICNGCLTHFPFRNMTVDHIVAQSKGGTDHIENLQLLCNACNSMKAVKTQAEFMVALRDAGLRYGD